MALSYHYPNLCKTDRPRPFLSFALASSRKPIKMRYRDCPFVRNQYVRTPPNAGLSTCHLYCCQTQPHDHLSVELCSRGRTSSQRSGCRSWAAPQYPVPGRPQGGRGRAAQLNSSISESGCSTGPSRRLRTGPGSETDTPPSCPAPSAPARNSSSGPTSASARPGQPSLTAYPGGR